MPLQLFTVELRGLFQQSVQLVVLLRGRPVTCLARDVQAVTSGKVFNGLDETQPVQFHDKADHRAVGAAPEAVIELFVLAYRE